MLLADAVADVEAGHVHHGVGAHGEAPGLERGVDVGGRRALEHHRLHLLEIGLDHAVADEAEADAGDDADLADALGDRHRCRERVLGGRLAAHDFEQPHDVGGREEMHADDIAAAAWSTAAIWSTSSVEVLVARMAPGLATASSLANTSFFSGHVLEHRLDDEVGVGEGLELETRREMGDAARAFVGAEMRPRLTLLSMRLADALGAPVERGLVGLDDGHRQPGVEEGERDARAHGAGADDADRLDLARLHVRADVGNVGGLPLGEEGVLQRAGVGACRPAPANSSRSRSRPVL